MLDPAKSNDGKREREIGCCAKQISMRLRLIGAAVEIQEYDVGFISANHAQRCIGIGNLANAVPGVPEDFLQNIAEGFVRIDWQNARNSYRNDRCCQDTPS